MTLITATTSTRDPIHREVADRLDSFAWVFSRVASVLAGRDVPVKFGSTAYGTAHTDGTSITIDRTELTNVLLAAVRERNLLSVVDEVGWAEGLVYHETSHVLFTPRLNHRPTKDIRDIPHAMAWYAFNVLEDARIERFFLARYSVAAPYFTRTITKFVTEAPDEAATAWLLLHGRKYLPKKLREAARARFEAKNPDIDSDRVAWLIDRYTRLVFPTDSDEAVRLVRELADILYDLRTGNGGFGGGTGGGVVWEPFDNHGEAKKGKAEPLTEERKVRDEADEIDEAREAAEAEEAEAEEAEAEADGAGESGDEAGEAGDGEAEGDGADGGEGAEGAEGAEGDGGEGDTEAESEKPGGYSPSTGGENEGRDAPDTDPDEFERLLAETLDEAEETVANEARKTLYEANKAFHDANADVELGEVHRKSYRGEFWPSSGHDRRVRDLVAALEDLRGAAAPSWVRRVDRGRLNVPAVMEARGAHFDVFDRWIDNGEDAGSVEMVVLVDMSGSMAGMMNDVTGKMHLLIEAAEELEIPITVLGYANESVLLHKPGGEHLKKPLTYGGGTDPTGAVLAAERILSNSSARHKLLFSLTDGEWYMNDRVVNALDAINSIDGASSTLVYLLPEHRNYSGARRSIFAKLAKKDNNNHGSAVVGSPDEALEAITTELANAIASDHIV